LRKKTPNPLVTFYADSMFSIVLSKEDKKKMKMKLHYKNRPALHKTFDE